MKQELRLTPFTREKGMKLNVIEITDFAFHTNETTPTSSVGKKIAQAFRKGKPGRIYSPITKAPFHDRISYIAEFFNSDPDFIQYIKDQQKQGYKVVLQFPKEGVPVVLGKDTVDFMNSTKGQRIFRRLYKSVDSE